MNRSTPRNRSTLRNRRDLSVECLRGVAIILVVAFHVGGAEPSMGIGLDWDAPLRRVMQSLTYLRMPLFTAISGWVYSQRPVTAPLLFSFVTKKVRRLLLPMLFVGAAFWLLRYVLPLDGPVLPLSDMGRIAIYQYIHFWYLQALFMIFLLVSALELLSVFRHFALWFTVTLSAFAFSLLVEPSFPYFSYNGFTYLLPYFLIGIGLARFEPLLLSRRSLWLIASLALVLQLTFELTRLELLPSSLTPSWAMSKRSLFGAMLSTSYVMLLFGWRRFSNPGRLPSSLVCLGTRSWPIYLFHPIFYALSTALLRSMGVTSPWLSFPLGLACGLTGPIALEQALAMNRYTRTLLLGQAPPAAPLRPVPSTP